MNFFEIVSSHLKDLTDNEHKLFEFVVSNMENINGKSIRSVASMAYVSTATFIRFVKKIGFSGYSEFATVIKFTLINEKESPNKSIFYTEKLSYKESYLKNIEETIRVIKDKQLNLISQKLKQKPELYFFAKDATKHLVEYITFIYSIAGFKVFFPNDHNYRKIISREIDQDSLVFIMSFNGENKEFIELISNLKREKAPLIVSITGADNNTIQNLSDINFYFFTDCLKCNNVDIGSRVSVAIIMELILYQFLYD